MKHKAIKDHKISPENQKLIQFKINSLSENITWTKGGRRLALAFSKSEKSIMKNIKEKNIYILCRKIDFVFFFKAFE